VLVPVQSKNVNAWKDIYSYYQLKTPPSWTVIEIWSSESLCCWRFWARICKIACQNFLLKRIWNVDFVKQLLVRTFDSRCDRPKNSLLRSPHSVSDVNERFRKVRGDELMCSFICLVDQEKLKTKRIKSFKFVHFVVVTPSPCKQVKIYIYIYIYICIYLCIYNNWIPT
jgi:hypothetical protein